MIKDLDQPRRLKVDETHLKAKKNTQKIEDKQKKDIMPNSEVDERRKIQIGGGGGGEREKP